MFKPPNIRTVDEILDSAFKRAKKVSVPKGKRVARARQLSIGKVRTMSQYISKELGGYIRGFPNLDELDVFHRELFDVVIGLDKFKHNLGALDRCKKVIISIASGSIRNMKRMDDVPGLKRETKAAYGRISSVLKESSRNFEFLRTAAGEMRNVPEISTELSTIVIAGYPNVGKSQLVRSLSTAKPKIATYPFTTKNVSIGIFEKENRRYQVIDTPGLLDRPYEKRNRIEKQAISALRHLATIIIFLLDPSETCGYPLESQLGLLASIDKNFSAPIIEVENKADILTTSTQRPKISALTGDGVEELRDTIIEILTKKK